MKIQRAVYLESKILQAVVSNFFNANKPVGAICHGVVLAARSLSDRESAIKNRKTTALLSKQELSAWATTYIWLKNYYRTYPKTVEEEVRSCLASQNNFISGPTPIFRDTPDKLKYGFTVRDGNYLSARWPGDAHKFATDFFEMLNEKLD